MSLPPTFTFSLFLSAHHWRRLSRGASSLSRLNALATVNILSPASPWDEQTDTNHCVDAMGRGEKEKGSEGHALFLLQPSMMRGNKGKKEERANASI